MINLVEWAYYFSRREDILAPGSRRMLPRKRDKGEREMRWEPWFSRKRWAWDASRERREIARGRKNRKATPEINGSSLVLLLRVILAPNPIPVRHPRAHTKISRLITFASHGTAVRQQVVCLNGAASLSLQNGKVYVYIKISKILFLAFIFLFVLFLRIFLWSDNYF